MFPRATVEFVFLFLLPLHLRERNLITLPLIKIKKSLNNAFLVVFLGLWVKLSHRNQNFHHPKHNGLVMRKNLTRVFFIEHARTILTKVNLTFYRPVDFQKRIFCFFPRTRDMIYMDHRRHGHEWKSVLSFNYPNTRRPRKGTERRAHVIIIIHAVYMY